MTITPGEAAGRARWLALAAISLLGLLFSGCAPTTTVTRAPTATPAATYLPFPTPTPPPPNRTLEQAWSGVHIAKLPLYLPGSARFFFENAATPDGQWLVGEVAPSSQSATFMPYVALYNLFNHALRPIHTLQTAKSGVVGASADGDWLAWSESYGMSPGAWSLDVYNLRTGKFQRVVSGVSSETVYGWTSAPVVSHDTLIWSQMTPFKGNGPAEGYKHILVRMLPLDGGAITTLATSANAAALSWPWAGWFAQTDANGGGYFQFKNLATGQTESLNQSGNDLALSGESAVFNISSTQIYLAPDVTRAGGAQSVFLAPSGGEADEVSISPRLIAWFEQGDMLPQVFDRQQRAYVRLPLGYAVNTFAWTGGNLLVWLQASARPDANGTAITDTICVVDTQALPVAPPA